MIKVLAFITDLCSFSNSEVPDSTSTPIFRKKPILPRSSCGQSLRVKTLEVSGCTKSTAMTSCSIADYDDAASTARPSNPSFTNLERTRKESIFDGKECSDPNNVTFGCMGDKVYDTQVLDVPYRNLEDMKSVLC